MLLYLIHFWTDICWLIQKIQCLVTDFNFFKKTWNTRIKKKEKDP